MRSVGETPAVSIPGSDGPTSLTTVAVVGTTGYTGQEVRRLIDAHPGLGAPRLLTARHATADAPGDAPDAPEPFHPERLDGVAVVFLCTPHGVAQPLARTELERGCRVVDLSADFRLRDPELHARTYGAKHTAPELLDEVVYGLTEHARPRLPDARLVANPGCYPTSVLLPLLPLVSAGLVDQDVPVVADCKSGVSGAGNTPAPSNVFGAVHDNFRAYAVGGHRHAPEIKQEAGIRKLVFVPHLLPVFRGILSTIYLRPVQGASAEGMRAHLQDYYEGEPFVRVLDGEEGQPSLADVQRTNRCHVALAEQDGHVVITSAIDNLVKGAAGQALQNMNLMLGFPEDAGLT
jgi:N-acetyl-gamma-glutamyl-phosphate reductase